MTDMWGDILEDLDPQEVGGLPTVQTFRTLPEPNDPPTWRGVVKPTSEDVRRLQLVNRQRNPDRAVFISGYSDASLHSDTHRAGWGIWLRDSNTRILRCGPCPPWVKSSNDAELTAVFAAIWTAVSNFDTGKANILVLKTDSQHVARLYGWNGGASKLPKKIQVLDLLHRSYQLVEDAELKLIVQWVKGHRGAEDTPAFLNTQADRMAREAMKTQRSWKHVIPLGEPKP